MSSVNKEEDEWVDELEDTFEENKGGETEKVVSQMETLDRKKVSRDVIGRSHQARQKPKGLVESMMKCVITDSTLEHGIRNYQVALTPRTERRYQSPLLSGRKVVSQIPRAAVTNSPLHSPRRARGGRERVRVYASPARLPHERKMILQSHIVTKKEETSQVVENPPSRNICEEPYLLSHPGTPLVNKSLLNVASSQCSDKEVIVMKGLLWVQQDKLFSRWKERFIVLTSHYLQFFKKTSSRLSEMGAFMMKVRLSDLASVSLEDRRGYLTLVIFCQKEGRLVIRKTEGIREWHHCLNLFLTRGKVMPKERKMETTEEFWERVVKDEGVKTSGNTDASYSCLTPPTSSALLKKSPSIPPSSFCLPSSPFHSRSSEDDSGLESMKTSTSDSGSFDQLSDPEWQNQKAQKPNQTALYYRSDQIKKDLEKYKKGKEKHERGVSKAEYSKFRAKLALISP